MTENKKAHLPNVNTIYTENEKSLFLLMIVKIAWWVLHKQRDFLFLELL